MTGHNITLVEPKARLAQSYIEAIDEGFLLGGIRPDDFDEQYKMMQDDFANWLVWRNDLNRPVELPDGRSVQRIAQTNWWLVQGDYFIGELACRHELNDFLLRYAGHVGYGVRPCEQRKGYGSMMLRLALPEIAKLGIQKVLITSKADNKGSVGVIEACGGVFDGEVEDPFGRSPTPMRRYWVATRGAP